LANILSIHDRSTRDLNHIKYFEYSYRYSKRDPKITKPIYFREKSGDEIVVLKFCPCCGGELLNDSNDEKLETIELYTNWIEPVEKFNIREAIKQEFEQLALLPSPISKNLPMFSKLVYHGNDLKLQNRFNDMRIGGYLSDKYLINDPDKPYEISLDIIEASKREFLVVSINPKCRWINKPHTILS
jgi:hypothetical protein